jgi:hypothetical protein
VPFLLKGRPVGFLDEMANVANARNVGNGVFAPVANVANPANVANAANVAHPANVAGGVLGSSAAGTRASYNAPLQRVQGRLASSKGVRDLLKCRCPRLNPRSDRMTEHHGYERAGSH